MKRTVFISHSSKDKAVSEEVCSYLEANGISCWIAPRDVTPGKNYGAAIVDAIDECDVFVLILTDESNKSGQVAREVERAASNNDVIIPFRIQQVEPSRNLEFYVSSSHWLDATEKPLANHLPSLLDAITNWQSSHSSRERKTPAPIAPPPLPARRPYVWLAVVAGAILLGLVLFGIALYQAFRHTRTSKQTTATPVLTTPSAISPSPEPVASPMPVLVESPTLAIAASPASTPPLAVPPSPTPSVAVLETPAPSPTMPPLRRRPGEPLNPQGAQAASPPAPSPTTLPMRRKPGEPLEPTSSPAKKPSGETAAPASAPVIREVVASSELKAPRESYRPNLAFDGKPSTVWISKAGGLHQSISAHFKSPVIIRRVSILNGHGEDEEHYKMGNRVKTLRVTFGDGGTQMLTLEDKMKMQRFELEPHPPVDWMKFEILSVFRGSKHNRTPIAEIAFNQD